MSEKQKILLAEDDLNMGILLVEFLENEGFEVKLCRNGESAFKAFEQQKFEICLLDVMMPVMDGFTLGQKIRQQNARIPILFLTARGLKSDKEKGYELGADDYITKPFDEEELLWKIRALIRRLPQKEEKASGRRLLGNYLFCPENQSLSLNGKEKRLTEKETKILDFLSRTTNQVVKREDLLEGLWGENDYFLGRSLDVFISRLRKYLAEDDRLKIETVFGVGFVFRVDEK